VLVAVVVVTLLRIQVLDFESTKLSYQCIVKSDTESSKGYNKRSTFFLYINVLENLGKFIAYIKLLFSAM